MLLILIFKHTVMNTTYPRMHVSLYVKDIGETVKFYDTFFGQVADKIKPGYAKYMLDKPSLVISFVENPAKVKPDFGHLGFQVESRSEMEARLTDARQQGIVALEEMNTSCCYALQDKFWAADPDGYQWEVYYFHHDVEFNDPHKKEIANPPCCSPHMQHMAVADIPVLEEQPCCDDKCC